MYEGRFESAPSSDKMLLSILRSPLEVWEVVSDLIIINVSVM
jgi:hypothetical protein